MAGRTRWQGGPDGRENHGRPHVGLLQEQRNSLSVWAAGHSRDPCVRGPAGGKEKWLLGRRSQVFLVSSS